MAVSFKNLIVFLIICSVFKSIIPGRIPQQIKQNVSDLHENSNEIHPANASVIKYENLNIREKRGIISLLQTVGSLFFNDSSDIELSNVENITETHNINDIENVKRSKRFIDVLNVVLFGFPRIITDVIYANGIRNYIKNVKELDSQLLNNLKDDIESKKHRSKRSNAPFFASLALMEIVHYRRELVDFFLVNDDDKTETSALKQQFIRSHRQAPHFVTKSCKTNDIVEVKSRKRRSVIATMMPVVGRLIGWTAAMSIAGVSAVAADILIRDAIAQKNAKALSRISIDCNLNLYGCLNGFCWHNCGPRLSSADWCFSTKKNLTEHPVVMTQCSNDLDCSPCDGCATTCYMEGGTVNETGQLMV
ncbi:uncharacterized protein LOC116348965 [Contarinia nasturtii]|uniref:uncharacterized protein LOC116348965 n=1 Tax=Contarinia nasturtii TaxID=265458 RepID=UPI0012D3AE36|nr:uncharacterized protein LOC116348965 [Contarinia nasturtii]